MDVYVQICVGLIMASIFFIAWVISDIVQVLERINFTLTRLEKGRRETP